MGKGGGRRRIPGGTEVAEKNRLETWSATEIGWRPLGGVAAGLALPRGAAGRHHGDGTEKKQNSVLKCLMVPVTFSEPQAEEPDPVYPYQVPMTEDQEPQDMRDREPSNELGAPSSPDATQSKTQDEGHRSRPQRYNLRPNPPPSL
ncbi:hypothetical protein NDU88_003528 [Pleurodeles waltl]|uniref:Uncharacterized protein n=1 Tax=Pleurodeles waltl TaxID=8319 RepID=A0AAV7TPV7_PLEWA|nr:hypothetical protein NDU88_003528 [Pleurodeles waltl]